MAVVAIRLSSHTVFYSDLVPGLWLLVPFFVGPVLASEEPSLPLHQVYW
jgi:hypothetical protein